MQRRTFSSSEWDKITSDFDDLNLIQTWEYGQVKAERGPWEIDRAVFTRDHEIVGAVQAAVRHVPFTRRGLVWINRGPLTRRGGASDPALIDAMLRLLHDEWVLRRGMVLRIALPVEESHNFPLPTGDAALQCTGRRGWASARIDLAEDVDELWSAMARDCRNRIGKAQRRGVTVDSATEAAFREFLRAYGDFLKKSEFPTQVTPAFLERMQETLPPERKMLAFVGAHEGQPLGGVLVARFGDTCEYLAGVNNDRGRKIGAGQLILSSAIHHIKSLGYRWFDMGGLDPERTPEGIAKFKSAFGGEVYRYAGELAADDGTLAGRLISHIVKRARGG